MDECLVEPKKLDEADHRRSAEKDFLDWCESQIKADFPLDNGKTYRQHLKTAYPDPDDPLAPETAKILASPAPCGLAFLWGYWLDLSRTRGSGMVAPMPLTYSELKAWAELRPDNYLNSHIVEMIIQIDCVFRRAWSDRKDKDDQKDERRT